MCLSHQKDPWLAAIHVWRDLHTFVLTPKSADSMQMICHLFAQIINLRNASLLNSLVTALETQQLFYVANK